MYGCMKYFRRWGGDRGRNWPPCRGSCVRGTSGRRRSTEPAGADETRSVLRIVPSPPRKYHDLMMSRRADDRSPATSRAPPRAVASAAQALCWREERRAGRAPRRRNGRHARQPRAHPFVLRPSDPVVSPVTMGATAPTRSAAPSRCAHAVLLCKLNRRVRRRLIGHRWQG